MESASETSRPRMATGDLVLPCLRDMEVGTLFSCGTGQTCRPSQTPEFTDHQWDRPRLSQRWALVSSGPELYRVLDVPYQLALKSLSGQTDDLELPLVSARLDLAKPNSRALVLWAARETGERIMVRPPVRESQDTIRTKKITHYIDNLTIGKQLLVIIVLSEINEGDLATIHKALDRIGCSHGDMSDVRSRKGLEKLETTLENIEDKAEKNCFIYPEQSRDLNSISKARELIDRFVEMEENVGHLRQTRSEDVTFTRCHLRQHPQRQLPSDGGFPQQEEQVDEEKLRIFDSCFVGVLRAKDVLQHASRESLREHQLDLLNQKNRELDETENNLGHFVKHILTLDTTGTRNIQEYADKYRDSDYEYEMKTLLQDLPLRLSPREGPLNILVLGKAGHGKSSTANSILGTKQCRSSSSFSSETDCCQHFRVVIDGCHLHVVDTPGIMNPSRPHESMKIMLTAIEHCPLGFHAILLVFKYGSRMTREETKTLKLFERVFGKNVMKQNGVFLITHADQFQPRESEGMQSIQQFIKAEEKENEDFQAVVSKCGGRCLVFDNVSQDPRVQRKQRLQLVETIDRMLRENGKSLFRLEHFQAAEKNRTEMEEESKAREKQLAEKEKTIEAKLKVIKEIAKKQVPQKRKAIEDKVNAIHRKLELLTTNLTVRENFVEKAVKEANEYEEQLDEILNRMKVATETDARMTCFPHVGESSQPGTDEVDRVQTEETPLVAGEVEEGTETACFPGNTNVRLQDGRCVTMMSLQVGDVILCGREDGSLTYSAVYMFGHKDDFSPSNCLVLSTATTTLRVSHDHLVFRRHLGSCAAIPARKVLVGDAIAVYRPGAATLQWEPVTDIQSRWETGVMAPFTLEGTVVVDGVLASCYVAVTSHTLCHALLWPMRKLAVLAPRLSAQLHRPGEGGLPPWVRLCLHHLLPWLPRHRLLSA